MRIVCAVAAMSLAACAGATATLDLDNQTAAARSSVLADGTALRLKLVAVYLAEDVDPVTMDNVGRTAMIWLNPQCEDDIGACNVAGTSGSGPRITDYFDLARPSAEISADLHAQQLPIDPGAYRYARVEMCKGTPGEGPPSVPTLMWRGPGMPDEQPFSSNDCGRTSQPFAAPLEVAAGDAVEVSLGYDLADAIVTGAPSTCGIAGDPRCFRACADTAPGQRSCMDFPDFAPTAQKL
jgi:hypothetical protein